MAADPRPADPVHPASRRRPHGRPVLSEEGFDSACDEILNLVVGLRKEHAQLRARAAEERRSRSAYPRSGLEGGGSPTNIIDDDGTPIAQHSDPVGELVVSQDDKTGPATTALVDVVERVHQARRLLEQAASKAAGSRTLRPGSDESLSRDWCSNCGSAGVMTPTYRDSGDPDRGLPPEPRCRACYDWWRAHRGESDWPSEMPKALVKDRAANVRLTTRRVDEVVGEWRKRRGPSSSARRRPKRRRAS